jgi:hypothetical protein
LHKNQAALFVPGLRAGPNAVTLLPWHIARYLTLGEF